MPPLPSRPALPRLPACAALVSVLACTNGLPDERRIEYTRMLGMRVDVDEPVNPDVPTRTEALPFERVTLTPWLVDPAGPLSAATVADEVDPRWFACSLRPGQGLGSCLLSSLPVAPSEIPDCPVPDGAIPDPGSEEIPAPPSPCRLVVADPVRPAFVVPLDALYLFGGDLEVTMIGGSPGESQAATCERAFFDLAGDLPQSCLIATQRVSIGPDSTLFAYAEALGFDVGAPPAPDQPEEPDRNMRLMGAEVYVVPAQGEPRPPVVVQSGDVVTAPADASVFVTGLGLHDDLQTYLTYVQSDDGDRWEPKTELADGSWFRTWGTLVGGSTQDAEGMIEWRLTGEEDEEERPPSDRARLFHVLRDDRTGVDWFWFEIALE